MVLPPLRPYPFPADPAPVQGVLRLPTRGGSVMSADVTEALAPMLADGFDHHEHEHIKPGVRVRNRGEQYSEARQFGTAEVVAVLRKPGSWEQKYGRLNIEVLVRRDRDGSLGWWADYGTRLTEGCWHCDGDGCDLCSKREAS